MLAGPASVADDPTQESLIGELRVVSSAFKNARPWNVFWSQVRVAVVEPWPAYPGAAPAKSACCARWQEPPSGKLCIVSSAFKNTRPWNVLWSHVIKAAVISWPAYPGAAPPTSACCARWPGMVPGFFSRASRHALIVCAISSWYALIASVILRALCAPGTVNMRGGQVKKNSQFLHKNMAVRAPVQDTSCSPQTLHHASDAACAPSRFP